MTTKPVRHRAPIRRIHADGTPCTHPMTPSRQPKDPACPGATEYTATCSCGDWTLTNGIRAYVEEQARSHIHRHNTKVTR